MLSYVFLISETIFCTLCMLQTKLPLSWITGPWVTISTKQLESKVMQFSEEHLETILCRLCEMITRWDPDRRELENLPDQPEMLDLMLMKNLGLSKVNTSLFCYIPTFCLSNRLAGLLWSLQKTTPSFSWDMSLMTRWIPHRPWDIVDSFLNFQDLNITIDQLDRDNIVYFDEDLMSRTLFIVSSKRCAHSKNPRH